MGKVLLVESNSLTRGAISSLLNVIFGEQLAIIETDSCETAVAIMENQQGVEVVLCEQEALGQDRWDCLAHLTRSFSIPAVLFSATNSDIAIRALAYVIKGYFSNKEALGILSDVTRGQGVDVFPETLTPASREGAPALLNAIAQIVAVKDPSAACIGHRMLSRRRNEILLLLKVGHSNKEIATKLGISEGTVKAQLKSIYRVLGVRNRTEAAILDLVDKGLRPLVDSSSDAEASDLTPAQIVSHRVV